MGLDPTSSDVAFAARVTLLSTACFNTDQAQFQIRDLLFTSKLL
jgi:hypothetical protein